MTCGHGTRAHELGRGQGARACLRAGLTFTRCPTADGDTEGLGHELEGLGGHLDRELIDRLPFGTGRQLGRRSAAAVATKRTPRARSPAAAGGRAVGGAAQPRHWHTRASGPLRCCACREGAARSLAGLGRSTTGRWHAGRRVLGWLRAARRRKRQAALHRAAAHLTELLLDLVLGEVLGLLCLGHGGSRL